jgi:hypothetical protein
MVSTLSDQRFFLANQSASLRTKYQVEQIASSQTILHLTKNRLTGTCVAPDVGYPSGNTP